MSVVCSSNINLKFGNSSISAVTAYTEEATVISPLVCSNNRSHCILYSYTLTLLQTFFKGNLIGLPSSKPFLLVSSCIQEETPKPYRGLAKDSFNVM